MNIKGLDYLLTFECNSRCRHCCYLAGPQRPGFISPDQAEQWLTELYEIQPLQTITIHGGEPFLYFDVMLHVLKKARGLGVQKRWVITNGFWAKDYDIAKEKLTVLKEAGLTAITFSVDAFHQEYVPFDNVRIAIECAAQIDLETVAIDSYFLFAEERKNTYNIRTKEYLDNLGMIYNIEINKFAAHFTGRAARLLIEQDYTQEQIPKGRCRPPFWLGGDLRDPETIEIDCEGNVSLCPGISIGNARKQSLTEIIRSYDYEKHPIVKIIVEKGPIGLYKLACSYGYKGTKKFVDECHLCYEMRRYLRKQYEQYLAPEDCYYKG